MIYNGEPPKKPREINTGIIDEFLEYIGGIIIMFASIPLAGKLNRSIFHMTNDAARFIFMLIVMAVMYLGIYNLLWGKLIFSQFFPKNPEQYRSEPKDWNHHI